MNMGAPATWAGVCWNREENNGDDPIGRGRPTATQPEPSQPGRLDQRPNRRGIFARDAAVTLMNPFGGYSRPGYSGVRPLQERAISHFESGTDASIEVVQAIVS